MKDLTPNEKRVIDYMRISKTFMDPFAIGKGAGGIEFGSNSWAYEVCEKLESKGLVERSSNGWYRLTERGKS